MKKQKKISAKVLMKNDFSWIRKAHKKLAKDICRHIDKKMDQFLQAAISMI